MANTALEKYFKAVLLILGKEIPRSHKVTSLRASLVASSPGLKEINENFLTVLLNAYSLRYPDDLDVGFSICLLQPTILVELDRTVHRIRQRFSFTKKSGDRVETEVERRIEELDPDLVDSNCYFGSAQRPEVFVRLSSCYEMRVLSRNSIYEVYYLASIADDGDFPLEGLRSQSGEVQKTDKPDAIADHSGAPPL
jgi:hypothetical protein